MIVRSIGFAAGLLALCLTLPVAAIAQGSRPPVDSLHPPPGATMEQVLLGDRIFHGEAAGGKCSICHGLDAKGTAVGNDLTTGMWIWGDGSLRMIKATIVHNMAIAPGMDGELSPADVDAVAAYVWALGHPRR
jgi:mono/diheme cytochrome c family protein